QSLFETAGGCLETHRCVWQGSLLSVDGRELFCHFTAPDAESVRIAMLQAGSPRGLAWPGTIHDAPEFNEALLAKANVVVARRFDEPADIAAVQAIEDAGAGCLQVHRVRFVRTFFSADRRRMMCLYHAPDAESVRIAQREAGMPVERVWPFRQYRP
ncbi:MAG: DUF4242 domain-containing protein, partial [Gammaproteobacteria bacterium]|nr:DUF4242 domain-containing protein [Gammaproteobacteria bacterium]